MRKIKHIICICIAFSFSSELFAQHLPQYTQYMLNDFAINPAIAGKNKEYWECKSNNRYQWVGLTDAPRTYILSLQGPFKNRKMGIGGTIYTDIVGPTRRVGFQFAYAYQVKLSEKYNLGLGLSAGLLQYSVDGSKLILHDQNDQILSNTYQKAYAPDFGGGLYLHSDKLFLSLSVPQIYRANLKFFDNQTTKNSVLEPHFYGLVGYKFDLSEDFKIEPSLMVKYVTPAPVKIDGGVRLIYQEMIWIAGSFRSNDAITATLGYLYNDWLMVGYSYDFTTTRLKNYSSGTHEIMIGLRFKNVSKSQASKAKE